MLSTIHFTYPVYKDLQKAIIRTLNVTGLHVSSLFKDLSNSFMKQNGVPMYLYFLKIFLNFFT